MNKQEMSLQQDNATPYTSHQISGAAAKIEWPNLLHPKHT